MRARQWVRWVLWGCFNPRPANWPGDAAVAAQGPDPGRVSIRARPIGRAMRGSSARWRTVAMRVSIRARPIGRAMQDRTMPVARRRLDLFQSAPGQLAGRCDPSADAGDAAALLDVFQSAPGQLAGRCLMLDRAGVSIAPGQLAGRCEAARGDRRFNPRPANWPGDAMVQGRMPRQHERDEFQSAPGQLAGRCCGMPTNTSQSAPAIGRRCSNDVSLAVSIRARPIGRAMRVAAISG